MKETITILHTNDLHGHYEFALRQAAFIKKRKKELHAQNENVLLLDGGDHMDMSMNECLATEGYIHLDMLAATEYDAMAVGNNELLRLPKQKIRKLSSDSKVPWLLLNLEEPDGSSIGGTKETLILEKGEHLKIGLFSATDQFEDLYENKHGFRNRDTLSAIKAGVASLKENGANLIIFLSHLGYKADLEIAPQVSGEIDVIIGAHSHTVLQKPEVVSDVIIVQAGCYGQYVGELKLTVDIENKKVLNHSGHLNEISLEDECDPELKEVMEKGRLETESFLSEIIYQADDDISHEDLVRICSDSLKEFWGTDIGIMYGGGMTEGLKEGDVTKGTLLNICKSMHTPVIMTLNGEKITGLIKQSYMEEITSKKVYGSGFRPHGIPIGKIQFSGVSWDGHDDEISNILVNGEPIDLNKTYTIGTGTPFLYEEVCGYLSVEGNELIDLGKDIMIKDVLINYLKEQYNASKNKSTV
ncbi:bifunctional metallophosphatase/5'-nucleotidase [Fictibacillus barbaricus]|uniref:2',3'-cyclic-nucleotide 2'-phosphodiesterase (5'-nucleotidase family) n=1 Tax=Fictibacillus barbaricus TaxID=182136 RepID=A0ABU1TW17_9BACL|nr:bifunctional UDP-sugar hydrolase/5'-nucleotidase [Fictibacillus barbaricus]MDR7071398.1 2',3'-cyclic-nucleotide 2'-phosphodiesterase (5'-nucleotidase family) [Fictibacillus barbaricus]